MPRNRITRDYPTWVTVAVLSSSGLVVALQGTLVVPLLAVLPGIFDATVVDTSWLITLTLLVGAISTPIAAKLADMHGKKRVMMICLGISIAGDALAVLSPSLTPLLISRGMVGVTMALVPIGISMMRDELPASRLGPAIGMMSLTMGVGAALGLPLAGVLEDTLGWQSVFAASGIVGVVVALAVLLVASESPNRPGGRFDLIGAVMLSVALSALLLLASKGNEWGWLSPPTLISAVVAVAVGIGWFAYERRVSQPVVDLTTSFARPVLLTNIVTLLLGFAMFTNFIAITQQVQVPVSAGGPGLDALGAGLVLLPAGLSIIVVAPISGRLVQRFGGRITIIVGSVMMAIAYLGRIVFDDNVAQITIGGVVVQATVALIFGATPAVIMRHVPLSETASATGLNALARTIGNAVNSAAAAAIFGSFALTTAGVPHPTEVAFGIVFALSAVAALVSAVLMFAVPKEAGTDADEARAEAFVAATAGEGAAVPEAALLVDETAFELRDEPAPAECRPGPA